MSTSYLAMMSGRSANGSALSGHSYIDCPSCGLRGKRRCLPRGNPRWVRLPVTLAPPCDSYIGGIRGATASDMVVAGTSNAGTTVVVDDANLEGR